MMSHLISDLYMPAVASGAKVMQYRPGLLQQHSGNNKRNDYHRMQTQYNISFLVAFMWPKTRSFVLLLGG